jgi:hypothetical protein
LRCVSYISRLILKHKVFSQLPITLQLLRCIGPLARASGILPTALGPVKGDNNIPMPNAFATSGRPSRCLF